MMKARARSRQSGISLVLFAFIALVLLLFAGLLIGIDSYYSAIQRLDGAAESGALSAAQDICDAKYSAIPRVYSIDRFHAVQDVADILGQNMTPSIAYGGQAVKGEGDCSGQHVLAASTCPTLSPGPTGAVIYCLDFPADTTDANVAHSSQVTLHLLWVVQQPFAGIVGPSTLSVTSAMGALIRISSPPAHGTAETYTAAVTADTPDAWWQLQENPCNNGAAAADSSTHSNPATYHNVSNSSLYCGQASLLPGSASSAGDNAVDESASPSLSYISSSFIHANPLTADHARSVELWLKDSAISGHNILFEGGTLAASEAFQVSVQYNHQLASSGDVSDSGILVEFSQPGTNVGAGEVFVPTAAATDGLPHMLDVTLSGANVVVYIDGIAQANGFINAPNQYISNADISCGGRICTVPLAPNTVTGGGGIQFGGGDGYGFTGQIEQVSVYGVALSPQQVAVHYAAATN